MDLSDDEFYSDSEGGYVPYEGYAREADDLVDKMLADPDDPLLDSHRFYDDFQWWTEHYSIDEGDRWGYEEYEGIPAVRGKAVPGGAPSSSNSEANSGVISSRKASSTKKQVDPRTLEKVAVLKDWKKRLKGSKETPASSSSTQSREDIQGGGNRGSKGSATENVKVRDDKSNAREKRDVHKGSLDAGVSKQGRRR